VHFGGVGVGEGLGARSLILTPDAFVLMTIQIIFGGGRVATALRLPAQVVEDPVLWPFDESSADSTLEVRAETGTVGIGESLLKSGMGAMKLSRACKHTKRTS
jgi:hypothetical protein